MLISAALRGSFLFAAVMFLLSSSSPWKYLASVVTAHEMTRAAAWSSNAALKHLPLTIEVDDAGYAKWFDARSPVSRERMRALLGAIAAHTRPTTKVIIDIDVSPIRGKDVQQHELDQFLQQSPNRWVLPATRTGDPSQVAELASWRSGLCKAGIAFGLPYIPTEFGSPSLTHQYRNSLGTSSGPRASCVDPELHFTQTPTPMLPIALKESYVLVFNGDLKALTASLDKLDPQSIVLGGTWGDGDVFTTPFGQRRGVQLHAATLAGIAIGEHLAPAMVEMILSWSFASMVSIVLFKFASGIGRKMAQPFSKMPGHSFFITRVQPVFAIVIVLTLIVCLLEATAIVHALTGFWIDTARIGCYTFVYLLVNWNLGRTAPLMLNNWGTVFRELILMPLKKDVQSIRQTISLIVGRNDDWDATESSFESAPVAKVTVSKSRAIFEGLCAVVSLLMQTVLPVVSFSYILYRSFG